MLKSDLIAILVAKRQLTQKQAELTIETIFDSMKKALCKGDNIEIRGLGAWCASRPSSRCWRLPQPAPEAGSSWLSAPSRDPIRRWSNSSPTSR